MTTICNFIPIRDSYSAIPTYSTREALFEGAATKKYNNALYKPHEVNISWKLTSSAQYTAFMGFFRTTLKEATEYFLLDLVIDIGPTIPHRCRTKGGMPRLVQFDGMTFTVSSILEVSVNPTYTGYILYQEPNIVSFTHTSPKLVGPLQPGDTIQVFNTEGTSVDGTGDWVWNGSTAVANFGNVTGFERNQAHSYACWFKTSNTSVDAYLFFKQNIAATRHGPAIFIQIGTGRIFFNLNNNSPGTNDLSTRTDLGYADGVLHSLVVTYDGSSHGTGINFYVDGSLVAKTTVQDALTTTILNTSPLLIGNDSFAFPFDGIMANCAQWTVELTSGDAALYHASGRYGELDNIGLSADPSWWVKFDSTDSIGSDNLIDQSGNDNHGTAQGGLAPESTESADLNLDGIYVISTVVPDNEITLTDPASVNSDWNILADAGNPGKYGPEGLGTVISTITRIPS